jgi:lipopolysaccharide transport system ATP-binding protein
MSNTAIQVEGLCKKYTISRERGPRYATLRDTLTDLAASLGRSAVRAFRPSMPTQPNPGREELWALRDVSFDVRQGERIGIIGRNGAGKTTLLRILSRITDPTRGRVTIRGRVASLLEVGTGFHPELTGRENIFLNGAILGMRKAEIQGKFDDIVAFAEVQQFLDTPVKRYSTGMQTRLAFSVAAHLEPEILLVDEVLAVGDLQFQRKCLGQMEQLSQAGRTVIFVSHQMNQIRRLCEKAIWVEEGQFRKVGPTAEVVGAYEAAVTSPNNSDERLSGAVKAKARFVRWEIIQPRGEEPNLLTSSGPVTLKFVVQVNRPVRSAHHGIALLKPDSQLLWGTAADDLNFDPGTYQFVYVLPGLPLRPGPYVWRVTLYDHDGLVDAWDCVPELIVCTEPMTHRRDEWAGILNVPCELRLEPNSH